MCKGCAACKGCGDCEVRVPDGWGCIEADDFEFADGSDVSDDELDEFLSGGPIDFEG